MSKDTALPVAFEHFPAVTMTPPHTPSAESAFHDHPMPERVYPHGMDMDGNPGQPFAEFPPREPHIVPPNGHPARTRSRIRFLDRLITIDTTIFHGTVESVSPLRRKPLSGKRRPCRDIVVDGRRFRLFSKRHPVVGDQVSVVGSEMAGRRLVTAVSRHSDHKIFRPSKSAFKVFNGTMPWSWLLIVSALIPIPMFLSIQASPHTGGWMPFFGLAMSALAMFTLPVLFTIMWNEAPSSIVMEEAERVARQTLERSD